MRGDGVCALGHNHHHSHSNTGRDGYLWELYNCTTNSANFLTLYTVLYRGNVQSPSLAWEGDNLCLRVFLECSFLQTVMYNWPQIEFILKR